MEDVVKTLSFYVLFLDDSTVYGQSFIISMCVTKFWKGNENLTSVYKKNLFSKYWAVSSIFDLLSYEKGSLCLLWDENYFPLNKSNGLGYQNIHLFLLISKMYIHKKKFFAKKLFSNWKFA